MNKSNVIVGNWSIFDAWLAGVPSKGLLQEIYVFTSDHFCRKLASGETPHRPYHINCLTDPYEIDLCYEDGTNLGICEIQKDQLIICEAEEPGMPRPNLFTSTVENRNALAFFRRVHDV